MNEIVKKNGIKFGLISGLISIVITSLMYSISIESFGNTWIGLLIVAFYIGLGVYVVSTAKKELNGNITFKEAFSSYFIYCVIGIIIANIFNYILFNFIDPEAKQKILEITLDKTVGMMENFNAPKEAIKEAVQKIKETDQYSIGSILQGSVFSIIFSSIIGLIIAAIFKTKTRENF
jgi:hypothetical protein